MELFTTTWSIRIRQQVLGSLRPDDDQPGAIQQQGLAPRPGNVPWPTNVKSGSVAPDSSKRKENLRWRANFRKWELSV
jgi:hypothetical protein